MKTALVTGASKGIGKAIALNLANDGFMVHATYNTGKIEAEMMEKENKNIHFHKCDFLFDEELKNLVDVLASIKLDAIVNNVGMIEFEDFNTFDFKIWKDTFQVNLFAPLYLSMMLKDNLNSGAAIVNIASLDGYVGSFSSVSYSASKAALINLTKSLGNNFGLRGIRVNSIAPGWINTGMATDASYEAKKLTPLGRNGKPEEVADLVSYLLSEKASFINGETIIIDGGYGNVDYIMLQEAKLPNK